MDDQMRVVGQKLDEITVKLNSMTEAITGLTETIKSVNEELGGNIMKLTEVIDKDIDIMTERAKDGFDTSRDRLMEISEEIRTLRRATGTEQIMRVNNALNQVLTLLQRAIDPNRIQQQLAEISQFIQAQGGGK